jgi:hypothetical protein
LSRISQLNIPGFSRLYSSIRFSTSGVDTCCGFYNVQRPDTERGKVETTFNSHEEHDIVMYMDTNTHSLRVSLIGSLKCRRMPSYNISRPIAQSFR